jgi:hypothetical protein
MESDMAQGIKTGGRAAGTPNKRTQDVIERLAALNCDPIEGMALIAMDNATPLDLRGRMFAELAQYVACKRKAVEVTTMEDKVVFQIGIQPPLEQFLTSAVLTSST